MSLTISGGVSLGSYEAGFLHYWVEFNKRNNLSKFPVITGASAGAINSLLTAVAQCDPNVENYEDSLFWRFWIPIGLESLVKAPAISPTALFSQSAIQDQIEMLRTHFKNRPSQSCQAIIGLSLTRKKPLRLRLTEKLTIPKFSESIHFRLSQSGKSRTPSPLRFENLPLSGLTTSQVLLPFSGDFDHDFEILTRVFSASAAFPLAFGPEKVATCMLNPRDPKKECTDLTAQTDEFIDGGIYDNQPLRLAITLSRKQMGSELPILFLDPTLYHYPELSTETTPQGELSLFPFVSKMAASLVLNARRTMMARLIEDEPSITKKITHAVANFPLNSYGLYAFQGFLESDFRQSDFIYGMYEARKILNQTFGHKELIRFPEENSSLPWMKFKCVSMILDGNNQLPAECRFMEEEKNRNTLILLQANLDRLFEACKKDSKKWDSSIAHCLKAQEGKERVQLFASEYGRPDPRSNKESDFDHFFRLLQFYHFKFNDLGLDREDAGHGLQRVHQELFKISIQFANKQDQPERGLLKIATQPLLNKIITYTPPSSIIYINAGPSQEIGWSKIIQRKQVIPTPFRYHFGLRTQGITTLFGYDRQLSLTPLAGLELELNKWSHGGTQYRIGLQVGHQFGSADHWGTQGCSVYALPSSEWACSSWVINPLLIVSFFDRVRFQLEPLIYPFSKGSPPFQLTFQLGYQFLLN